MLPLLIPILLGLVAEGPVPETLQRTVRTFDFEEAATHRLELPFGFDRVVPDGTPGPAVFGTTRPETGPTHSGAYAFVFALNGHSMAARTRPGAIPVRPGTDLAVSVWARADGLQLAGARLVAWLLNADGQRVGQVSISPMLEGTTGWRRLELVVEGQGHEAVELVAELQALQPGDRNDVHSILPPTADIQGTVYFDDVSVVQRPSVHLDDGHAGSIHHWGTPPTLNLRLADPVPEPVLWSLVVEDARGTVLSRHADRLPRHEERIEFDAPCPRRGWFRATLSATTPGGLQARDTLDFVVLDDGNPGKCANSIIQLPWMPGDEDMRLTKALGGGRLGIPAVDPEGRSVLSDVLVQRRLDAYLDDGGALEFHITSLPPAWCEAMALDPHQIDAFFQQGEARWGPLVDAIAMQWGPDAAWWRLGGDADEDTAALLLDRLEPLVPGVVIDTLPRTTTGMLEPFRSGSTMRVDAPWTIDERGRARPARHFVTMHALLRAFTNRTYAGSIRIEPGVEGWILQGGQQRDDALLVRRQDGGIDTNDLAIGPRATRVDLEGNTWQVQHRNGREAWTSADTPFLLEEIDGGLLRFQRDLQMLPESLPARPRRHVHQLQVRNTWDTPLRGTLQFANDERLQVEPASVELDLAPGESQLVDIDLVVTGPLSLGLRPIDAMLHATHPALQSVPMRCWLEVGLPGIDVQITTSHEDSTGPFQVRVVVHNQGETDCRLDVRLAGAGIGVLPDERVMVPAGDVGGHLFQVHVDDPRLHGSMVYVQVAEVDHTGSLSAGIRLPDAPTERMTTVPGTP